MFNKLQINYNLNKIRLIENTLTCFKVSPDFPNSPCIA